MISSWFLRVKSQSAIQPLRNFLESTLQIVNFTGLLNRRGLDDRTAEMVSVVEKYDPISAVMIDIDHFKKINDAHGHLIGDSVLKKLGELLKESVKGKDVAARYGGEEFILVLPQTGLSGALALTEQIRTAVENMNFKIKESGQSIGRITISSGVASLKKGQSFDKLIEQTDHLLYHAKKTGRNKTVTERDA
ncbi:MAG: GGDEF domain-containing protein [Desulfobacteraceae bacterium]|nr:MAG: GGDEF domain-containing protein [Desulfobacteraceae bacterium]